MTTLNIFKGYQNTLSFHSSDTHHKEIKENTEKSRQAVKDLESLIKQTKGNNIDNHFFSQNSFKMLIKSPKTMKKKTIRCLSDSQKSRFFDEKPENTLINSKSIYTFLDKIKLFDVIKPTFKQNTPLFKGKNLINSYRTPRKSRNNSMSSSNFTRYLTFLNSGNHNPTDILNKKQISIKIPSKTGFNTTNKENNIEIGSKNFDNLSNISRNNENMSKTNEILSKSQTKIVENPIKTPKNVDLLQLPRVKTLRKSVVNDSMIMEKMGNISRKVFEKLKKLENLNKNNKIKTFMELNKIFNNNQFLKGIFFDSAGKEMNPRLSESYIAQSVVIYPSKFNRNPLENKIKYNYEGIRILENLSEIIKDFCFNKKMLEIQAEEKNVVDLQKGLKKLENKYHNKQNNRIYKKLVKFSTTIEIQPTFNSQISKMIKSFEEKYGKLDKIKAKNKIVGEKVDNMMQDLYEKFLNINNKL